MLTRGTRRRTSQNRWKEATLAKQADGAKDDSGRLIIVSNRLPVSLERSNGEIAYQPSVGGLATSLKALSGSAEMVWLGWPGITPESEQEASQITQTLRADYGCIPIFLPPEQFERYYVGFSNGCLWPLFHYFTQYAHYNWDDWRAYEHINALFAQRVAAFIQPADRIWVHDYHLMLLPELIRQQAPEAVIGYFLHIPFPSYELFRALPWREQLLQGLLGADLIGFHSFSYARHFNSALLRILGFENEFGRVLVGERPVKVDTFPLGIDVDRFKSAHELPEVQASLQDLEEQASDRKIVLSVDRLDFTKGIVERLNAFSRFLEENPEWHGRVSLVSVLVPSRQSVPEYQSLKRQVDELIGRINGSFSRPGWTPIWYLYRQLPFESLVPFYLLADVALVTPLRDGMNLVAKEYLASRPDGSGVLILSETAGSAEELGEALIVNPLDQPGIVAKLLTALEMPLEEQQRRNQPMLRRLERYTTVRWAEDFLTQLDRAQADRPAYRTQSLSGERRRKVVQAYRGSSKRLLLLDYDGTLVGFHKRADGARPDQGLVRMLQQLRSDPANTVVVISGRDHATLENWLGEVDIDLVAEHGARLRRHGQAWEMTEEAGPGDWQAQVRPILDTYVDRTPGAYLEDKGSSLVWHYRQAEPELGSIRVKELIDTLESFLSNTSLHVMQGNKVIEVKQSNVNKGRAAQRWLAQEADYDFVLAIGDDVTDEDLFAAIPEPGFTVKVGHSTQSKARFYLQDADQVRTLLEDLTQADT